MTKSLRIKSLSIQALGVFKERTTFLFGTSENRPLVVIEGKNGCGKTTILQALQIVLFGDRYLGIQKKEYQSNLLRLIRRDCFEEPYIQAEVLLESSGNLEKFDISRSWSKSGNKIKENLVIYKNGKYLGLEESEWNETIDSYLPASLANLFFFDGEKIEQLADPEKMPEILRRATESLLGIHVIDTAINDISAYERRTILRQKTVSADSQKLLAEYSEKSKQLDDFEDRLSIATQEKATLQNRVDHLKKTLFHLKDNNEVAGLGAFKRALQLGEEKKRILKELSECKRLALEVVDDPRFPLAMLSRYWEKVSCKIRGEEKEVSDKKITAAIQAHDQKLLARISNELGQNSENVIRIIREELNILSALPVQKPLFLDMSLTEINSSIKAIKKSFTQSQENAKNLKTELDAVQTKLEKVPSEEVVEQLYKELQNKETELEHAEEAFKQKNSSVAGLLLEKKKLNAEKNSLEERLKKEAAGELKTKHILTAATRAKLLLSEYKKELLSNKACWLSTEISQCYKKILRKKGFIDKVIVDSENFTLSLQKEDGKKVHVQSLSAGERQMLATAILKAILRGSDCSIPVIVDTPLARLDGEHRMNLVKDFYSCVSPQTVILSTDEEIRGSVKDELQKYVSRVYSLRFDDAEQVTKIEVKND